MFGMSKEEKKDILAFSRQQKRICDLVFLIQANGKGDYTLDELLAMDDPQAWELIGILLDNSWRTKKRENYV